MSSGSLPEGAELLGLAERAVEKAVAAGADEAECYWSAAESVDMDIERGMLAGGNHSRRSGGCLRVVSGGRLGFAYFAAEQDVPHAAQQALRQAKAAPAKGFSLPEGGPVEPLAGRWDSEVAGLDPARAVGLVHDLLGGAREACPDAEIAGGGVGLSAGVDAISSSRGVSAWDRATETSLGVAVILNDPDTSISVWEGHGVHVGEVDAHAFGTLAGEKAMSLRHPQPLAAGGQLDVIFQPDSLSEMLGLVVDAVNGDEAMRGKTVWSQRLGEQVASPDVELLDDPRRAGGLGTTPVDGDGLATGRLPILSGGVLQTFLFDAWDAHEHGQASTASAQRSSFKSMPSTGVHHLVLESPKARRLEQMIADTDRGLLVDSVLGAHTANSTTGDFSITAPNAWLIEGGALAGPVEEVALAGNLPALLMGAVCGSEPKAMDGAFLPAAKLRGVDASV